MLDLSRIHDMQMSSILANHPDRKAIINPNRMAVALISKSVMDLRDRDPQQGLTKVIKLRGLPGGSMHIL